MLRFARFLTVWRSGTVAERKWRCYIDSALPTRRVNLIRKVFIKMEEITVPDDEKSLLEDSTPLDETESDDLDVEGDDDAADDGGDGGADGNDSKDR